MFRRVGRRTRKLVELAVYRVILPCLSWHRCNWRYLTSVSLLQPDEVTALARAAYKEVLGRTPGLDVDVLIEEPEVRLEQRTDSMGEAAHYVEFEVKSTSDYRSLVELESRIANIFREKLEDKGDAHYAYLTLNSQV